MEQASSVSPAGAAASDPRLTDTESNLRKPGEPMPVAQGRAPGGNLRLFVVHAPEDAWFAEGTRC